jgi:hypothetical protein
VWGRGGGGKERFVYVLGMREVDGVMERVFEGEWRYVNFLAMLISKKQIRVQSIPLSRDLWVRYRITCGIKMGGFSSS